MLDQQHKILYISGHNLLNFVVSTIINLQLYRPVPHNVARFITMYSDKVSSFNTVNNMVSSLKTFYKLSGFELNVQSPVIDLLLRSFRRTMSSQSKPKNPIEIGHLLLIKN